jgi:hypothetical protein
LATFAFRATAFAGGICNLTATGVLLCPFFEVGLVFDLVFGSGNNFARGVVDAVAGLDLGLDAGVGATRDFGFTGVGGTNSSSSSSSFIFGINFVVFWGIVADATFAADVALAAAPDVAPTVAPEVA